MDKSAARRAKHGWSTRYRADLKRWEARVTLKGQLGNNGRTKVKSLYAKSRADVEKKARECLHSIERGGFVAPQGGSPTVADWFGKWLTDVIEPNREPNTVRYYAYAVNLYIVPALGRKRLTALKVEDIRRLIANERANGRGPNALRAIYATLRAGLEQAWKDGLTEQNVAKRAGAPTVKPKEAKWLTPEDAATLLGAVKGSELGPMFSLALATGMRIGEVTGLRWADVDLAARRLRVGTQLQRKDGNFSHKSLKTNAANRVIDLSATAVEALQDAKGRQLLAEQPTPLGLVFLNAEGRPLHQKYVNDRLKAALKSAGLPIVSFHSLRHTAATAMLSAGVPIFNVSKVLGHSQISTTSNLYGHAVPNATRDAVDRLDRAYRDTGL